MTSGVRDPILAAFDRLVETAPGEALVISGDRLRSRGEVAALARQVESRLEGSAAESPLVALSAPNGSAFLAGFLAVRRSRRAVLLLDSSVREAAARETAAAMGARVLLSAAEPEAGAESFDVRTIDDAAAPPPAALDSAVLKLTSGSTGGPRGVLTSAGALVADDRALAAVMGLAASDRILAAIPMSHSYGLSSVVLPALLRGSPLVVPRAAGPFAALEACEAARVTFLPTVPAYLAALLSMASPPPLAASVRLVISAGAPLAPRVAAAFRRTYGQAVHVFYGASECGGICFDREGSAGERGTVGTPVDGVEVELERTDDADGPGRVVVRSPAVASAYHPAEPGLGDGRFVTGDLAEWRAGELALVGRTDDLINIRGKKVNPRTVESVLRRLPGVADVAVFGLDADNGDPAIQAFVACDRERLDLATVRTFCRDRLAKHQMPRFITLVAELPRTGRGKLDLRAMTRHALSQRPESVG